MSWVNRFPSSVLGLVIIVVMGLGPLITTDVSKSSNKQSYMHPNHSLENSKQSMSAPQNLKPKSGHRFCVAPMLDCTDRHARYFYRQLSKHSVLYSEMVTTGALIHGDRDRFLQFHPDEQPVALQLGGSDPRDLATCAEMARKWGYSEVNLNVGCPSDRVQKGRFGACLMKEPDLVAECVRAMAQTDIPITVKSRIGVDHQESYEALKHFVSLVASAGCRTFIIHARKAWLKGLSPKQNREIPALQYDLVYRLKQDFPALEIVINGGINKHSDIRAHLHKVDGVMLGREIYSNPYFLADIDSRYFGAGETIQTREEIIDAMIEYIRVEQSNGTPLKYITRHMVGLFRDIHGAKIWRRTLSENAFKPGADSSLLRHALAKVAAA